MIQAATMREQMIRMVVASQAKRKKLKTMIGKRFSDVGEPNQTFFERLVTIVRDRQWFKEGFDCCEVQLW